MKPTTKPNVGISFFTGAKLKDWNIGRLILSIIYTYGQDFAPQQVDYGDGWQPISASDYQLLESMWPKLDNILLKRENKYKSQLALLLGEGLAKPKPITLWVDDTYLLDEKHIQNLLDISLHLYELIRPEYGLIHNTEDKINMATFQHSKYGRTVLPTNLDKGLPGIYWANFFGLKIVNAIGKEKLLSPPWFKVIELSDGGILTLLESSPLSKAINRNRMEELQKVLGLENFYSVLNNDL